MIKDIQLSQITKKIGIRSIKSAGVEKLRVKILETGYLPEKPIIVAPNNNGYTLVDGGHRVAALGQLGIETVSALIDESSTTEFEQLRRARLANEVAETVIPSTFVDDAELVWELSDRKMGQVEIGGILGCSRNMVAKYVGLRKINEEAWGNVTDFIEMVTFPQKETVTSDVTKVTFNERLLREIVDLKPWQQLDLVNSLISDLVNKTRFKKLAEAYKVRNQIEDFIYETLSGISSDFIKNRVDGIHKGAYDQDWSIDNRPKITKFITAIQEEWDQASNTKVICGDFNVEVLKMEDNSIDFILTDIPYNISGYAGLTKIGQDIANTAFDGNDDWDTQSEDQYLLSLRTWVEQWTRILREGGSVISFCDRVMVSYLWRIFKDFNLKPKNVIVWERDNAHPSALVRRNLISASEFIVWAVKPGSQYTFNESNSWNRRNVIHAPFCAGSERIVNDRKETLHPTQKPLKVLNPLVEVFSNRGDVVFDGFAGVGSTGEAAISQGRKFIGIELNEEYYKAMVERIV